MELRMKLKTKNIHIVLKIRRQLKIYGKEVKNTLNINRRLFFIHLKILHCTMQKNTWG